MAPDPFPGRVNVVERREFFGVHAAHISIDNKMAQQGPAVRKPWQKALKPLPFTIRAGRFLPSVSCRQLYRNLGLLTSSSPRWIMQSARKIKTAHEHRGFGHEGLFRTDVET